ncbi:MAG: DUF1796 family putative cysteine peptidase [Janthinobacterium lividum]
MSELTTVIVDALYRGILGRAPEPQALQASSEWLDSHGVAQSLGGFVESFVASEEFRTRVNVTGFLSDPPAPHWPDRAPYRHAVSLGSNCYVSQMLKGQGLKRFSAPFDWVFSTPAMVEHCLRDDFATLLDRSLLEALPERPGAAGFELSENAFYRDSYGVPRMFNHHDVTTDADYGYLSRCAGRLRGVLRGGEPTLCVLAARDRPDALAEIESLGGALREIAPHADLLAVLVTEPAAGGLSFGMQAVHEAEGRLVMRFTPTSKMHPLSFDNPFDDVLMHRLVRSFRFEMPAKQG